MRSFTGRIDKLGPNDIFVFGSNTEGRHGKGAALTAKQRFGASYGQSSGRQGQSYAICTKNLRAKDPMRSVPLCKIGFEVHTFLVYASKHPELNFYVVKFGSSLAGYTEYEIADLFTCYDVPDNVYMNQDYSDIINGHWTKRL